MRWQRRRTATSGWSTIAAARPACDCRRCRWVCGTISATTRPHATKQATAEKPSNLGITTFRPGQQLRPAARLGRGSVRRNPSDRI